MGKERTAKERKEWLAIDLDRKAIYIDLLIGMDRGISLLHSSFRNVSGIPRMEVEELEDYCFFSSSKPSQNDGIGEQLHFLSSGADLVVGSRYGYGNSSQLLDRMGSRTTRAKRVTRFP